jgi:hypothetical protein
MAAKLFWAWVQFHCWRLRRLSHLENPMTTTQPAPDAEGLIKRLRGRQFMSAKEMNQLLDDAADALTAANERAEKAEREWGEALASEKLERNRANGWRSQAATIRAETVAETREECAKLVDAKGWRLTARAIRALTPTAPMTKGE